jgi:flagellar assembly factor FliW
MYEEACLIDPLYIAYHYSFSLPEVDTEDLEEFENQKKLILLHKRMIHLIKDLFQAAIDVDTNFPVLVMMKKLIDGDFRISQGLISNE